MTRPVAYLRARSLGALLLAYAYARVMRTSPAARTVAKRATVARQLPLLEDPCR